MSNFLELRFNLLLCITLLSMTCTAMVHQAFTNDSAPTEKVSMLYKYDVLATKGVVPSQRSKQSWNKPSFSEYSCQKTWMYVSGGSNGTCWCRSSVRGLVRCNNVSNQVAILNCYCMTYDNANFEDVIVGSCPYGCGSVNARSSHHPLPLNITDLNHGMCGRLNRDYRLCSKCINKFCPLVYSYDLNCVKCSGEYNWLKYVAVAYVPLTIFYFIVVFLRNRAVLVWIYNIKSRICVTSEFKGSFYNIKWNTCCGSQNNYNTIFSMELRFLPLPQFKYLS